MTIIYNPIDYTSVMEDIIITAYDVHSTTDLNYKYVAALFYHNGTTWIQVVSQQTRPLPSNYHGAFDFSTQCRNVFSTPLSVDNDDLLAFQYGLNNIYGRFKVELREVYNGVTSAVLASGEFYLFNSYNVDYFSFDYDQMKKIYDGKKYGLLTNRDLTNFKISKRAKFFFMPVLNFVGSSQSIAIDNVLDSFGTSLTTNYAHHLNISTQVLEANTLTLDYQNPQTISFLNESDADYVFGSITYEIVCDSLNNHYVLHFLNSYGAYESVLFSKPNKKDIKIEKKSYETKQHEVQFSGSVSIYSFKNADVAVVNKTSVAYKSSYNETLNLKSDLLTDKDYRWLKELLVSPSVYVTVNDSKVFMPCVIKQNNYEEKTYITNKLTQLDIQIELQKNFNVI